MNCHGRIRIFIQRCTIKQFQSTLLTWKMRWCPVQDHSDILFVKCIDQLLEIFRHSESAIRCIVSKSAILSGILIQIFHHRMKFHMGIFQFFYIIDQFLRIFPDSQTCLINRYRLMTVFIFLTCTHPRCIIPLIITHVFDNRCRCRREFRTCCIRIRFQLERTTFQFHFVFVNCTIPNSRNKQLIDS